MATVIEEFVARIGWQVDPAALTDFQRQVDGLVGPIVGIAKAFAGVSAALSAAVVVTNQETAEFINMAQAVGLTTEAAYGLSGVIKQIGLDQEVAIDLTEELNNKMGEMAALGDMSSVSDSLKILNLEFKELQNLAPEDQLATILDTAVALDDHQKAVSAADMLLGGEANKVVGFLRTVDMSFSQLLERQKQMTFLTEEGATGAQTFNYALGELTGVLGSIWKQISGLIGSALTPMIARLTDWFIANKEIIQQKISVWAEKLAKGLEVIWKALFSVIRFVNGVIQAMGGLKMTFRILASLLAGIQIFKFLSMLQALITLIQTAGTLGPLWNRLFALGKAGIAILLFAALIFAIQSFIHWLRGGESAVGKLGEAIANWAHMGMQWLANFFGFSKEEFDLWLIHFVDGIVDFYNKSVEFFTMLFEFIANVQWSDITEGWKLIFNEFGQWLTNLFNSIADYLMSLPNRILNSFLGLVGDIQETLAKIPLVGSLFEGKTVGRPEQIRQAPTTAAIQGAAQMIQAVSRNTAPTSNVTNQISITQNPGESAEALANKITEKIEQHTARAVRNTATGIDY